MGFSLIYLCAEGWEKSPVRRAKLGLARNYISRNFIYLGSLEWELIHQSAAVPNTLQLHEGHSALARYFPRIGQNPDAEL